MRSLGLSLTLACIASCQVPAEQFTPLDPPPSSLTYSANPATYTKNLVIAANTPSSSGGPVVSYSVAPPLPAGLTIASTTGVISGTPTAITATLNYTVTATNNGGNTTATISITVHDAPPSGLTYSTNPAAYTRNVPITANTPSSTGGVIASYAIAPALPAGLSLDTTTGVITGTPTATTAIASYTVTGTNAFGNTTVMLLISVNDLPPAGLTYSMNPAVYTKGTAIVANTPSSTGGAVTSYAVNPALPAGLSLDTTTGVITGTPTVLVTTATSYTVTATNGFGNTTVSLSITVNDAPPATLTYSTNPAVYTKGVAITANTPSSSGGAVVTYSVAPALPAGLLFNTSTGVITGTPTSITISASYMIVATNSGGSTSVTLMITVNDAAPTGLTYSTNPATYTKGVAIAPNTPSSGGGAVITYAVAPAVPAGLSLDTQSGIITGTPTMITASAAYTVTATNSGGTTNVVLTITVKDVAPSNLAYSANPAVYTKGVAIAANTPSSTGGSVISYSVAPALPAGLSLDTSTGIISGTPAAITLAANYTVTATNSGGSTNVQLRITVNDRPPSNLVYSANPASYAKGVAITPNTPSASGGAVVSYSIAPALSAGLTFDPTTGIISGTPTATAAATTYMVSATNSGGSTTAAISIAVLDPPGNLVYATNPVAYIKGVAIVPNTPSSSGGAVTMYSVAPALPPGLTFSTATGIIDGTPTSNTAPANYAVTATNSDGSTTSMVSLAVNNVSTAGLSSVIAAGFNHSCALVNGGVWCWGQNSYGQLGNGVTTGTCGAACESHVPTPVLGLPSGVQAVTAGDNNTCAIVNGGAWCWGEGANGQLGDGLGTNSGMPVRVSTLQSGVQAIAASGYHVCAIVNGGMKCWGSNGSGEIGTGTSGGNSLVPTQVVGLASGVQAIATGEFHTCAVVNGVAKCWGSNSKGQLGIGLADANPHASPAQVQNLTGGLQSITAGYQHTCAVVNGGALCWGDNYIGQLGDTTTTERDAPVQVFGLATGVQAITAASRANFTCALVNGAAQCWGFNSNGELGRGGLDNNPHTTPALVSNLTTGVQAIASGSDHVCALVNGGFQCWGTNSYGELGNGMTNLTGIAAPVQVIGLTTGVQAIATGASHSCSLVNGGVQCWGFNNHGQLGNNSTTNSPMPVRVAGLGIGVQAIATGAAHTCALVNGGVKCWGFNSNGQLGDATTNQSTVPVQVSGLTNGVQAIAAGGNHTCALTSGAVKCWGENLNGQLGDNTNLDRSSPTQVVGLINSVQAITAGANHTCALVAGGVYCWGSNANGQIGDNTTIERHAPVQLTNNGVQAVAAGGAHTCYLSGGSIFCWGLNVNGQLGDNTFTERHVPVQVFNLTAGAQSIVTGGNHSCAIVNGGTLCWGNNVKGQLGNNSIVDSSLPVQVSGVTTGGLAVAAGGSQTCALVNGSVLCWGNNVSGELGNNSTVDRHIPVQVSPWAP